MTTWLTSDWHLGHANIIRYCDRPYDDVAQMNDAMVQLHNELVAPDDEVWVLGDVAMGRLDDSLAHVSRFNGRLKLVMGNHDRCWPGLYRNGRKPERQARMRQLYRDAGFVELVESATLRIADHHVLAHHFPYLGDSHDTDRYADERPVDRGAWLVHGHVHEKWRQRGRQINVGVDAWAMRPVHIDTVAELIAAGARDLARLDPGGG